MTLAVATRYDRKHFVYQIFYDERSRASLDTGFLPLDNLANPRPDWFEFWSIRNFLNTQRLEDDTWYGFLSPRFQEKSGFTSAMVLDILEKHHAHGNVALFSHGWDQLSYFRNPFEQGDAWHHGLLDSSQHFFDAIGLSVDLKRLVTYATTSVFSNFVVAKPEYWLQWRDLANKLFDLAENQSLPALGDETKYRYGSAQTKIFIQERLSSIILSSGNFKTICPDVSQVGPIFRTLFNDDFATRRKLQICDHLKEKYCQTRDEDYLNMYYKIRRDIAVRNPPGYSNRSI